MSEFQPLEVVCRGSEPQLQVGEKQPFDNFKAEQQYSTWR